jgi:hypothetical protein
VFSIPFDPAEAIEFAARVECSWQEAIICVGQSGCHENFNYAKASIGDLSAALDVILE